MPMWSATFLRDEWALIELFPYGVAKDVRPALFLRNAVSSERQAFQFFSMRLNELMESAKPRRKGELPEWC